jgi:hypothetical protein
LSVSLTVPSFSVQYSPARFASKTSKADGYQETRDPHSHDGQPTLPTRKRNSALPFLYMKADTFCRSKSMSTSSRKFARPIESILRPTRMQKRWKESHRRVGPSNASLHVRMVPVLSTRLSFAPPPLSLFTDSGMRRGGDGRGGSSSYRHSGLSATSQSISSHSRRRSTKKPRCFAKGGSS